MSSNEQETRQKQESEQARASTPACCQPCAPGRGFAFKRMAERCAEAVEEQPKASPCDFGTARGGGCGGEGRGK